MLALSLPGWPVFAAFRSISNFRIETPIGALSCQRAEGYRIARRFDRRDTVLPQVPGLPRHNVERARFGIQGEATASFPWRDSRSGRPDAEVLTRAISLSREPDEIVIFEANLFDLGWFAVLVRFYQHYEICLYRDLFLC
jgi:hypothetical protein